jgi:hypothetical protein
MKTLSLAAFVHPARPPAKIKAWQKLHKPLIQHAFLG